MAVVGSWGDLVFSVDDKKIHTFDSLKWDCGARFATHNRHLKEPLLEYLSPDSETINFTMRLSVYLGINPMTELAKLLRASREGRVNRLAIGDVGYGTYKWALTKISNTMKTYDNTGNLLFATVDVTMQSYAKR